MFSSTINSEIGVNDGFGGAGGGGGGAGAACTTSGSSLLLQPAATSARLRPAAAQRLIESQFFLRLIMTCHLCISIDSSHQTSQHRSGRQFVKFPLYARNKSLTTL